MDCKEGFPGDSEVRIYLSMQEIQVGSLGEEGMAIHSSMLANPMGRGANQVIVHGVTKELDTT